MCLATEDKALSPLPGPAIQELHWDSLRSRQEALMSGSKLLCRRRASARHELPAYELKCPHKILKTLCGMLQGLV